MRAGSVAPQQERRTCRGDIVAKQNTVETGTWSNPESEQLYRDHWPHDAGLFERYEEGEQCGGCAFFAPFNVDFGLCCYVKSRHHLETVFEHFTCPVFVNDGWDAHSFRDWDIDESGNFRPKRDGMGTSPFQA
jgi:hypothetical protein